MQSILPQDAQRLLTLYPATQPLQFPFFPRELRERRLCFGGAGLCGIQESGIILDPVLGFSYQHAWKVMTAVSSLLPALLFLIKQTLVVFLLISCSENKLPLLKLSGAVLVSTQQLVHQSSSCSSWRKEQEEVSVRRSVSKDGHPHEQQFLKTSQHFPVIIIKKILFFSMSFLKLSICSCVHLYVCLCVCVHRHVCIWRQIQS